MSLIQELKRRNVIRVGIAYVVVAWLIAQVAELALDSFNAPDWVIQTILVVLLLGLPLALFFAWAFELTPEGIKRDKDVDRDESITPRTGRRLDRAIIVLLSLAVVYFVADKFVLQPGAADIAVTDKSIAVLPFADFSPGGDQGWFADGLTDEILNALARTRDLRVASRTSSFGYRDSDQDAKAIAAELDVAHILEGSVRRAGDRIRVTAQLIRASDDAHLWSETFDADSDDSIEIQERIAFDIASLLDTAMDPEELRRMVAAGTDSIAAWEALVQMRASHRRAIDELGRSGNGEEVMRLYDDVVRADPTFAEAHLSFAGILFDWLSPSSVQSGPPGLSDSDKQSLFEDASARAARYARNDVAKLGAEILRARVQVRIPDLVKLTRARLDLRPYDREAWQDHIEALVMASRYDDARAFVREIEAHDFASSEHLADLYTFISRVDLEAGLAGAMEMLAKPSQSASELYQSQRILLYAGRNAEAADAGRRYIDAAGGEIWVLMVKIRQACAEGRVADAEQHYAEFDFSSIPIATSNIQWLALRTLGRVGEAEELLRPLDQPDLLVRLAGLLVYTHFDPSPYPNLAQRLEEQGVMRREIMPLPFACER